jgi:exopolysaccharide biosynthesis WecB/TagA/CpsF family protein
LEQLVKKHWSNKVHILLYGTYPDLLAKTKVFLENKWYQVVYAQDGYTNLDRNSVEKALPHQDGSINVLLVARATPLYPIQEIRSHANKEQIKKYHLLTMNQWGTFDWRVGKQKRPPEVIRYLRLERLWRLISDPKRNYKKVLDSLGIFGYIFCYLLLKKGSR